MTPAVRADMIRRAACPHGAKKAQFCVVCLEMFIVDAEMQAAAAEREACAQIFDPFNNERGRWAAEAIRARGAP